MRPEFATREFWETRRLFLRKAALLTLVAAAAWTTWDHFCWLAYDPQQISCTGYRLFVVVRHQVPTRAGQYVAFVTDDRFAPMFKVGERFGKLIACTFPCHIEEGVDHLTVNGHVRDSINPALVAKLGKRPADFVRSLDLKPGEFFVMGVDPHSFDSRYWGVVKPEQVVGRVYPLL